MPHLTCVLDDGRWSWTRTRRAVAVHESLPGVMGARVVEIERTPVPGPWPSNLLYADPWRPLKLRGPHVP